MKEEKEKNEKSDFLSTCQAIIIGIAIITIPLEIIFKNYILLGITIITMIILYIILNTYKVIINLLQSIDNKIR